MKNRIPTPITEAEVISAALLAQEARTLLTFMNEMTECLAGLRLLTASTDSQLETFEDGIKKYALEYAKEHLKWLRNCCIRKTSALLVYNDPETNPWALQEDALKGPQD